MNEERRLLVEEGVLKALRNGPADGLTSPQIHSVSPGNWEETTEVLSLLAASGRIREWHGSPYPSYTLFVGAEEPEEEGESRRPHSWTEEGRKARRETFDDYPEELRLMIPQAIHAIEYQQQMNYMNPAWEPIIGVLEAKLKEVEEKHGG